MPLSSQIMGVKHVAVSAQRAGSDAMALVYDIDIRWAGSPDISLLLTPSRKWIVKQRRIGAELHLCWGEALSLEDPALLRSARVHCKFLARVQLQ